MDDYSNLYRNFISKRKSLLIAPAGYGKTYSISECLKHTNGLHLILTHTHAGVASLKEKIKNNGISSDKYRVETIDSYAQKYVNAFYAGTDVPEQDNKEYFPFIIRKATELISINPIKDIIKLTYTGLFVDEYQDCTKTQHGFIMRLAEILPTHIVGDPLQGIFDFKEEIVDFNNDLPGFEKYELDTPWRWKDTNPELGESLKKIRKKLENKENIDLTKTNNAIEIINTEKKDIFKKDSKYNAKIWDLIENNNDILIIYPDSTNKNLRLEIIKRFNNTLRLVEAIDDKEFYEFSKEFDKSTPDIIYKTIFDFICKVFNISEIKKWFNESGMLKKRDLQDRKKIEPIEKDLEDLQNPNNIISFIKVRNVLDKISILDKGIKCYRKQLFYDICGALVEAECNKTSVYESMTNIKNRKRRMGKEIKGKCIGTTLLVKGLQFETVAVLNAHEFTDPKNFYVALTRASKKLVIFTNKSTLSPYSKSGNSAR
jgi:DNA helicase-2/ATP-dependent DNA helicase PcrA